MARAPRYFGGSCATVAVLLLAWAAAYGQAENPDAPIAVTDEDTAPERPPVARLFEVRDEIEAYLLSIQVPAKPEAPGDRRTELDELGTKLEVMRNGAADGDLRRLRLNDLLDLQTQLRSTVRDLALVETPLNARAKPRASQLDELDARESEWQQLAEVAAARDAPASVLAVARTMSDELARTRDALVEERNAALEDLSVIAELQHLANGFDAELRQRRQVLDVASQQAADLPLWHVDVWRSTLGWAAATELIAHSARLVADHLRSNPVRVVGLFLLLWLAAHWLLRATGKRVEEGMQQDSASIRGAAVFRRPSSAALLTAIIGTAWFGPPAPAAFSNLLSAIVPFPAAALATTVFARPIRLSIYTIAVVLAVMALMPFVETMPLLSRFIVIAQAAVSLVAIWLDQQHGRFARALPIVRPVVIYWGVRIVCTALIATIVLEIVGLVGIAGTLRELVLGGLGLAMIFAAIAYVLIALSLALVHLRPFASLPVVRNQRWTIVQTIRRWIRYLALALWLLATLQFAGLLDYVVERLGSLLDAEVKIGEITLDVSSITAGAVILFATWLISSIVRFALAGKSLSGVNVAAGLTFAISKLLRYAIAVAGFFFALAAMGFDLTKVTVLAGALGLGIGFGLQNIVQNFIAGLILLFERPININDIAKVDDLMGTVKELNIRSTVIETFDGAEVIVPNADLVTKTVTNWTKSNRRRRAEIDVGVAYGTDSQQVIDILERIAKSYPEVMTDPQAFAIFLGFGESSLNFRLFVWLTDLSAVLTTPSRIRQDLLRELAAASIEIPYPQRDVRVTMLGGARPGDAPAPDTAA